MYCEKELKENEICSYSKKKGMKQILVSVIMLFLVVMTSGCNKMENVELKDYLNDTPDINGINGKGIIEVSDLFDDSSFEMDLLADLEKTDGKELENMSDADLEELLAEAGEGLLECEQALEDIELTIKKDGVEVQELTGLSNGDVIWVEVKSKNPVNNYLKKTFQTGSVEFSVKDLIEAKSLDVFELVKLNVTYTGVNGDAYVRFDWEEDALPDGLEVTFETKGASGNLRNGDTVEVFLSYDGEEWDEKGYVPLEELKTFTVEGLDSYVSKIEDIQTDQLLKMKEQIENSLRAEQKNEWLDGILIEEMEYLGCYLLNKNEDNMGFGSENIIHLVYKVNILENFAPNGGEDTRFSYYYYGTYEDLMMDKDGTLNLESADYAPCWGGFVRTIQVGEGFLWGETMVSYDGCETWEEIVEDCVENYEDDYSTVTDITYEE